jgi:sporulation protein YlmC with PRC-barrel domain
MFKRTASALLATTLLTGAAFAQTATTPSTTPAPAAAAAMSGQFVTDQPVGQFRASKVIGVNLYGPDDQRIGNINDVLLDGSGDIKTVIVGVGGFLGIGEKNVGIPWSAVQWVMTKPDAPATTASTTSATMAAPMTAGTSPSPTPTTAAAPASATPARSPAEQATYNGYPDHGKVTMTKADLQNAPTFRYYSDTHSATGASNATPPATRP